MRQFAAATVACLGALSISLLATTAHAQTKIRVWTDTARIVTFKAYQAAHPGVELDLLTVANTELVTKLQLALRANADVPDVIFMASTNHQAQLSTRDPNYLMDLTQVIPQKVFDGFLPNANSVCNINGRPWAASSNWSVFTCWKRYAP